MLLSYPSIVVDQLHRISEAEIAIDIANLNQLAGRLNLFKRKGMQRPVGAGCHLRLPHSMVEQTVSDTSAPHHHFKMEGIHMSKDLWRQGDLMAKTDLKDAYFVVQFYLLDCHALLAWVFTKGSNNGPKGNGHQTHCLHIRHADHVGSSKRSHSGDGVPDHVGSSNRSHSGDSVYTRNLGFVTNFPKSILEARRMLEFLGFQSRFELHGAQTLTYKNEEHQKGYRKGPCI